jgi:hypothetical protein
MKIGQEFKKINPNTNNLVCGAIVGESGDEYIVKCIGGAGEEYIKKEELMEWEDVVSDLPHYSYFDSSK